MLAHKRKQIIKDMVDKYRIVRVSDLSERFNISDVTIRRDLKELEQQGYLKRTHGGAIKVTNAAVEPPITELESLRMREKFLIAQEAYNHIRDNDAIVMDSSSTIALITTMIKNGDKKNLTVVTNSFRAVMDLMNCPHVEVIHVGGQLRRNIQSSIGPIAENTMKTLIVDKAFIGVNGVHLKSGLSTPNLYESQMKRVMMACANEVFVLADSSKFHQTFLSVICPLSEVDYLITDSQVDEDTLQQAEVAGLNLLVASDGKKARTKDEA